MSFDPNSNSDIEEFITEVKSLQSVLGLPDRLIVTTLKEKFLTHRLHFIIVQLPKEMFEMLRAMFPKNQTVIQNLSNPFSLHQAESVSFNYHDKQRASKTPKKNVSFDKDNLVEAAVQKLTNSIDKLTMFKDNCPSRDVPSNRTP